METSIDRWFDYVSGQGTADEVFQAVAMELPPLSSLILDRSCQFQCQHCIFQKENSSGSLPNVVAVLKMLAQLPNVRVVHEGRQLTRRQLPLLEAISHAGYPIGIIESGTYTTLIEHILQTDLRFDWMDISIDGPEKIHNLQRNSDRSWGVAIEGLRRVREVLKPQSKATSLMTVTSLNYEHVLDTATEVFGRGVDEWHLTTMSLRQGLERVQANEQQLETALKQMTDISKVHKKIFLRIYNLEDMRALVSIIGKDTFSKLLTEAKVTQNALVLDIGFLLFFYPVSLAPGETLVIDVDNWWRLPYCIKYTLDELGKGRDVYGNDISVYNVAEITEDTNVAQVFEKVVASWRSYKGEQQLLEERALLQPLFQKER